MTNESQLRDPSGTRATNATAAGETPHQPLGTLFGGPVALAAEFAPLTHADSVLLVSESRLVDLNGPLWPALIALLDGQRSAAEIVRALRGSFPAPEVVEGLGALARQNVLATTPEPQPFAGLDGKTVGLKGGGAGTAVMRDALAAAGVTVGDEDDAAAFDIAIVDDYLSLSDAEPENRDRPWLPIKLSGDVAWFGPLFEPGKGACWKCLEHRLRRTREARTLAPRGAEPLGVGAIATAQIAALHVARWLAQPGRADHALTNNLATFDPVTLRVDLHPVVQRPQCEACGSGRALEPQIPILDYDPAGGGSDSGQLKDEEVLARFAHHVDEITGLVTALEPVAEDPVHVYRARYVRPLPAETAQRAIENRQLVAAGKGTAAITARTGALAEALERYSSTFDGTERLVVAPLDALDGKAIHPNDSMLFSQDQYERRKAETGLKVRVPDPFDPGAPAGWLRAWSLSQGDWRYVAAGWALMGFRGPGAAETVGDSNGNAAGASIGDAILRGAGEVIERDGVALWWYNRARRPGVNLDGIDPGYLQRLTDHYRTLDREFWLLDLTTDLGVPTFAAVSQRTDGGPAVPVIAAGAHMSPRIAALRALTEMNQMLPHALARAPREDRPAFTDERGDSMSLTNLDEHSYIRPDRDLPETRLDAFATPWEDGMAAQIGWLGERLERAGHELIMLDHTRPDVGLPVVRVIIPGLRHFWRRLAPGRLYDVPVGLGWLDKATPEHEVNPLDLAI